MLTKRKIKKFCIHTIGIFLTNAEKDITVKKYRGQYIISLQNLRAPERIVKDTWDKHSIGTKFKNVCLSIDIWRY